MSPNMMWLRDSEPVPLLPQGRRSLLNPPTPARQILLRRHLIRHVRAPMIGQRVENILCAENTGVNVAVTIRNFRDEVLHHSCLIFRLDQTLIQRATERNLAAIAVSTG